MIPPQMKMFDRFGQLWVRDQSYQDFDAKAPGWLAIRSGGQAVFPFSVALNRWGFQDEKGERFFVAILPDEEAQLIKGETEV